MSSKDEIVLCQIYEEHECKNCYEGRNEFRVTYEFKRNLFHYTSKWSGCQSEDEDELTSLTTGSLTELIQAVPQAVAHKLRKISRKMIKAFTYKEPDLSDDSE